MTFRHYDAWKLSSPPDDLTPGTRDGETCNRLPEPDEDAPRGWRPRPCGGLMVVQEEGIVCESCGEWA